MLELPLRDDVVRESDMFSKFEVPLEAICS